MESMQERRARFEAEQAEQKRIRVLIVKLKRLIRSDITQHGYRAVTLQYQYVKENPGKYLLRVKGLGHDQVVECYDEVLNEYANKK